MRFVFMHVNTFKCISVRMGSRGRLPDWNLSALSMAQLNSQNITLEHFSLQNPWCAAKRRILFLDFEYNTKSV